MNSLSVIIPSRNASNLSACMSAVRAAGEVCDITVVSDFDDHAKARAVLNELPGVGSLCKVGRIVAGVKPFIYARNCNIGIIDSSGDDVILLNDDALLETPQGFTLLQRAAEEHPEYGIIGATTNVTGQPLQWRKNIGLREVPHLAFVCVLIPRRTIDRVGLLDERYCLDYGVEDRDYCEAVRRSGLKVGVHDGCFVDHGKLVSTFRGDPKTPKSFAQNWALFQQKWGVTA